MRRSRIAADGGHARRGRWVVVWRRHAALALLGAGLTAAAAEAGAVCPELPGFAGIKRLRADRFNLLGPYSDDATGVAAVKTRRLEPQHVNFGQFRTPSLRNVALTAPYMRDGRYDTLRPVVRHCSELDMERIHEDGGQRRRPLRLTEAESADLVAFLETLTAPGATAPPPPVA